MESNKAWATGFVVSEKHLRSAVVAVGKRIRMTGERQSYLVQAANDRFAIMTKPFNARKTYLYTITDLERNVRGPCNLIFGLPCDVNSPERASEVLDMLSRKEMEVSYRRDKDLTPDEVKQLKDT